MFSFQADFGSINLGKVIIDSKKEDGHGVDAIYLFLKVSGVLVSSLFFVVTSLELKIVH